MPLSRKDQELLDKMTADMPPDHARAARERVEQEQADLDAKNQEKTGD